MGHNGWMEDFFIIIFFLFLERTRYGSFFFYYYYFSLSWEDEYKEEGGWQNFGEKGRMIRMEGEGEKRLTTNCGDSDFVVLEKKKKSSDFFHFFLII